MEKVLLLDQNYMPLSVVSWKKAVKLIVKDKAEAIKTKKTIKMGRFVLHSIIRLTYKISWNSYKSFAKFSRKNVIVRDGFRCQYCGKLIGKNATIDHIVPRSKGGTGSYTNCVACCQKCNEKKANQTIAQSGMKLIKTPRRPRVIFLHLSKINNIPQEWNEYIFGGPQ